MVKTQTGRILAPVLGGGRNTLLTEVLKIETAQKIKPSTSGRGWHEVPGEGKSLREEWIDSGSESGMTKMYKVQGDKIVKNLFTYSLTHLLIYSLQRKLFW